MKELLTSASQVEILNSNQQNIFVWLGAWLVVIPFLCKESQGLQQSQKFTMSPSKDHVNLNERLPLTLDEDDLNPNDCENFLVFIALVNNITLKFELPYATNSILTGFLLIKFSRCWRIVKIETHRVHNKSFHTCLNK